MTGMTTPSAAHTDPAPDTATATPDAQPAPYILREDDVVITPGAQSKDQCYPENPHYTWGEFAGAAIELGGYGDISWVNPYTGNRLTLLHAFDKDESLITAIRRLLDAMEQYGGKV